MKEFFIKGRRIRPGLTITNGWITYVVTNEYKWHYVGSGNHAEVHMSSRELNMLLIEQVIKNMADSADSVGKKLERLNQRIAEAMSKQPRRKE